MQWNQPTWRQIMKPEEVDGASAERAAKGFRVPALGQAASLRPETRGVPSNDRQHDLSLDGHRTSAVSRHPNGLFAQNTAATSDYSLGANSAHIQGTYPVSGPPPVAVQESVPHVTNTIATQSLPSATRTRAQHLNPPPTLLLSAQEHASSRVRSLLERDWTTPELGLGALGLYSLYCMVSA